MTLEPVVTPHGLLTLRQTAEAPALEPALGLRLAKAFERGSGHGLVWLGANEVGTALPPVLSYWRELGVRYVTALCALPGVGDGRAKLPVPIPAGGELRRDGSGRSTNDRRGIPDAGRPRQSLAKHGCGL